MTKYKKVELIVGTILSNYKIFACPADFLTTVLQEEEIKYNELELDEKFCGIITQNNKGRNCIVVNKAIQPIGRKNFTIAHELGHYFLKHPLLENSERKCTDNELSEELNENLSKSDEVEANIFSACFLMPTRMVLDTFYYVANRTNRSTSRPLYVDNQACNYKDWITCCDIFQQRFKTSKQAIRYRMEKLGLLNFNMNESIGFKYNILK